MDYFYLSFSFWIFLFLHQSSDAAAIYQEVNLFYFFNSKEQLFYIHVFYLFKCLVDADCSDASFCDQSYLVCETCIPCEILLNRASGVNTCATSEEGCGLCLTGYHDLEIFNWFCFISK